MPEMQIWIDLNYLELQIIFSAILFIWFFWFFFSQENTTLKSQNISTFFFFNRNFSLFQFLTAICQTSIQSILFSPFVTSQAELPHSCCFLHPAPGPEVTCNNWCRGSTVAPSTPDLFHHEIEDQNQPS